MDERIMINFARPIALFPIRDCVLLPCAVQPLHIFEPRYRRMVRDVLDGSGLIAIARFEEDVAPRETLSGRSALQEAVCIGYVEQYEMIGDGRFVILLRGVCRAAIERELEHHDPYRVADLRATEWPLVDDEKLTEQREELRALLTDKAFDPLEDIDELRGLFDQSMSTVGLIDLLIHSATEEAAERYAMLRQTDPFVRSRWLVGRLVELRDLVRSGTWR
ncbi:MAG: LON peptidase substrate-binding domain-containing protein [Desulfobacterales bacterium]|nr:LON peptidase substrate-binding domain-containing protein [Desulfobacterales bacterium]